MIVDSGRLLMNVKILQTQTHLSVQVDFFQIVHYVEKLVI